MSSDNNHLDQVIASSRGGVALRVDKPKPVVPPSPVQGDPERPASAAVNAQVEMSYAEAMKAVDARLELEGLLKVKRPRKSDRVRITELQKIALKRHVLTERGWVLVPKAKGGR